MSGVSELEIKLFLLHFEKNFFRVIISYVNLAPKIHA